MSDDSALKNVIANFAVLEQLVINLTHLVSADFDDPLDVRTALMQDLRSRFDPKQIAPSDRARQELYKLAGQQMDRLEPRILGDIGDAAKQ